MAQSEPTDTERERQALRIFEAALELDLEGRFRHVDAACGGDGALRGRVEVLRRQFALKVSRHRAAHPAGDPSTPEGSQAVVMLGVPLAKER